MESVYTIVKHAKLFFNRVAGRCDYHFKFEIIDYDDIDGKQLHHNLIYGCDFPDLPLNRLCVLAFHQQEKFDSIENHSFRIKIPYNPGKVITISVYDYIIRLDDNSILHCDVKNLSNKLDSEGKLSLMDIDKILYEHYVSVKDWELAFQLAVL